MNHDFRLKRIAFALWLRTGSKPFPPYLEKMLWNTGVLSTHDLTDDRIRYSTHHSLLSEWEYLLRLTFSSGSYQPHQHSSSSYGNAPRSDFDALCKAYCDDGDGPGNDLFESLAYDVQQADGALAKFAATLGAADECDQQNHDMLSARQIDLKKLTGLFGHYYQRGNYSICHDILKRMSEFSITWEIEECFGHFFHITGNQEEATRHLLNSISLGSPRSHRCLITIGLISTRHAEIKNPKYALSLFDRALRSLVATGLSGEDLDYECAVITNARALSQYQLGKFNDAIIELQQAIDSLNVTQHQDRKQFLALLHDSCAVLEMSSRQAGWENRSRSHFDNVLRLYPKFHRYHINIANFEQLQTNRDAEIHHLKIANELAPVNIYIKERLIEAYENSDMLREANELLMLIMILNPKNSNSYREAVSRVKRNRGLMNGS